MGANAAENRRAGFRRIRFRRVLEHIDANLDAELSVDRLSGIAALSKYHFHRQFVERFGIGVYKYVQLCRLKRASYQLAFRSHLPIIDIALANGYDTPESFARAFRNRLGQSPSEFRHRPQWTPWHAVYRSLRELRSMHMKPDTPARQVRIIDFRDTRVAAYEHRGDPRLVGDSVRRFIAWRKLNRLPPNSSATYNILHNDPTQVAAEDYRLDICAATDLDIADNPFGVVGKTIPGGRCAVLRHSGSDETLGESVRYLYSQWLPQSGETSRDFPIYLQRVSFFPDVPEHAAVTDIFLPIR